MRILHIDPDDIDNPLSGGGPRRTFEICRRLARRHEITVVTPTFPGSTPMLLREGVRYVRLGRRVGNHGSSHHITFFFALPGLVRRQSCDLVVEDFMPPASVTLTPLLARAPVIASVQWSYARTLAQQYRVPFHWIEAAGLRFYDNFITMSDDARLDLLRRRPGARVETIGNGVSDDLFDVPETPGDAILYLGRVDLERKGVGMLLEAYARLPAPRPPLIIAGHGWEHAATERRAGELGVAATTRVLGRVGAVERRDLLAACRFAVFPSREETFGMVITEACAASRPVIHFDLPPMNEIARGAGNIAVPAFDIPLFAEAMASLAHAHDAEIVARGRACRAHVQDQRWDAVAARQEAFYLEAVARA